MAPIIPETSTPPEEIAELIGETVIDKTVDMVEPGTNDQQSKPLTEEIIDGFKANDSEKYSAKSPEKAKKAGKAAAPEKKVMVMIAAGLALAVIGLILLFVSAALGILLILIGAGIMIFGVYKPLSHKLAK